MTDQPPLSQAIWDTLSPDAQAAVTALVQSFERRIADLEERLGKDSTNSSKPPSSDPPSVKRRPPAPASGKKRGGQPGPRHHTRALVPPERVRQVIECKPPACRCCGLDLRGDDPEPLSLIGATNRANVPAEQPLPTSSSRARHRCPADASRLLTRLVLFAIEEAIEDCNIRPATSPSRGPRRGPPSCHSRRITLPKTSFDSIRACASRTASNA